MKILVVEDDYYFADEIQQDVKTRFPECEVEKVRTEKQCLDLFRSEDAPTYQVIILDVMLPWDEEARSVPDEDARKEGYFKAGIRCLGAIRASRTAGKTPVIVHSALDTASIQQAIRQKGIEQAGITIVPKSGDPEPLINTLAPLLQ